MRLKKNLNWFKDIDVELIIDVGRTKRTVKEILRWRRGTVIKLEDSVKNQLSIYANNLYIGYGDIHRTDDGEMYLKVQSLEIDEGVIENDSQINDL